MTKVVLVLALAGVSCASVQRHPAITSAIVGGVIGFGACQIGDGTNATCGVVTASTTVFLGGIAWLATTFLDTSDHTLVDPDEVPIRRERLRAEPMPTPLPVALPVQAPPVVPPAVPVDAGVTNSDATE